MLDQLSIIPIDGEEGLVKVIKPQMVRVMNELINRELQMVINRQLRTSEELALGRKIWRVRDIVIPPVKLRDAMNPFRKKDPTLYYYLQRSDVEDLNRLASLLDDTSFKKDGKSQIDRLRDCIELICGQDSSRGKEKTAKILKDISGNEEFHDRMMAGIFDRIDGTVKTPTAAIKEIVSDDQDEFGIYKNSIEMMLHPEFQAEIHKGINKRKAERSEKIEIRDRILGGETLEDVLKDIRIREESKRSILGVLKKGIHSFALRKPKQITATGAIRAVNEYNSKVEAIVEVHKKEPQTPYTNARVIAVMDDMLRELHADDTREMGFKAIRGESSVAENVRLQWRKARRGVLKRNKERKQWGQDTIVAMQQDKRAQNAVIRMQKFILEAESIADADIDYLMIAARYSDKKNKNFRILQFMTNNLDRIHNETLAIHMAHYIERNDSGELRKKALDFEKQRSQGMEKLTEKPELNEVIQKQNIHELWRKWEAGKVAFYSRVGKEIGKARDILGAPMSALMGSFKIASSVAGRSSVAHTSSANLRRRDVLGLNFVRARRKPFLKKKADLVI